MIEPSDGEGDPVVVERSFAVEQDDLIEMTAADLAELQRLRATHRDLSATARIAVRQAEEIEEELEGVGRALERAARSHRGDVGDRSGLEARADSLAERVDSLLEALRGRSGQGGFGGGGGGDDGPVPLLRQLSEANGLHQAFAPATQHERAVLERTAPLLDEHLETLDALLAAMADFRQALDDVGAPWTPGRRVRRGG